jgi:putative hydroxymethylpyrimidine transport system permease protein
MATVGPAPEGRAPIGRAPAMAAIGRAPLLAATRRALGGWRAFALLALMLGAWELYADLGGSSRRLILPPPHQVASALYTDRSLLWSNFLVTAQEVLLGILVATAGALLLAIAIHFSRTLRRAVYPLLVASQAIPIPMIAPLLVLWLGFGIEPKLLVIALVSFFPIVVTTLAGFASVDRDLLKLMRTFDAPRRRIFRHIELPAALPGVLTGTKIAVVVAVIGAVFAEWAGSTSGLGYLFLQSEPQLLTARAYAAVAILSAFAIGLFGLLTVAERLAVPWAYTDQNQKENAPSETLRNRPARRHLSAGRRLR